MVTKNDELEKLEDVSVKRRLVFAPKINTKYDRLRCSAYTSDKPSMTQQQYANECDLNNLVDKNMQFKDPAFLTKLQLLGAGEKVQPLYGDFSDVPTYENALNTINKATDDFMSLPAKIRARFENDPVKLLEFVNNPDNYEEGLSLGIYKARTAPSAIADGDVGAITPVSTPDVPQVQPVGQT